MSNMYRVERITWKDVLAVIVIISVIVLLSTLSGCAVTRDIAVEDSRVLPVGLKVFETSLGYHVLVPEEFPSESWRVAKRWNEIIHPREGRITATRMFYKSDGSKEWVDYIEQYTMLTDKLVELCAYSKTDGFVCIVDK